MKKVLIITTILIIFYSFCGCSQNQKSLNTVGFFNYSNYETVLKYATPFYIEGRYSRGINIKDFLEQDKDNVIIKDIKEHHYAVMKIKAPNGSEHKLFFLYDDDYYICDSIFYSRLYSENDLKEIVKGASKNEVKRILKTDDLIEYPAYENVSECVVWCDNGTFTAIRFKDDVVEKVENMDDFSILFEALKENGYWE